MNIADFTDEEIAAAVHFIDGHVEDLDPQELRAWRIISEMLKGRALSHREVEAENEVINVNLTGGDTDWDAVDRAEREQRPGGTA